MIKSIPLKVLGIYEANQSNSTMSHETGVFRCPLRQNGLVVDETKDVTINHSNEE